MKKTFVVILYTLAGVIIIPAVVLVIAYNNLLGFIISGDMSGLGYAAIFWTSPIVGLIIGLVVGLLRIKKK